MSVNASSSNSVKGPIAFFAENDFNPTVPKSDDDSKAEREKLSASGTNKVDAAATRSVEASSTEGGFSDEMNLALDKLSVGGYTMAPTSWAPKEEDIAGVIGWHVGTAPNLYWVGGITTKSGEMHSITGDTHPLAHQYAALFEVHAQLDKYPLQWDKAIIGGYDWNYPTWQGVLDQGVKGIMRHPNNEDALLVTLEKPVEGTDIQKLVITRMGDDDQQFNTLESMLNERLADAAKSWQ